MIVTELVRLEKAEAPLAAESALRTAFGNREDFDHLSRSLVLFRLYPTTYAVAPFALFFIQAPPAAGVNLNADAHCIRAEIPITELMADDALLLAEAQVLYICDHYRDQILGLWERVRHWLADERFAA